jgi:cytochrome c553
MSRKRIYVWMIVIAIAFYLLLATPGHAQEPTPENDANCVACHTHQYYVYDSGKWFCLCDAPMHCIYCHGGRTDSQDKDVAHEGLVLYPTRDHAARCQTCHEEDYMSRVVTFASVAGISSESQAIVTATPVLPVEPQPTPFLLRFRQLEPLKLAGLGLLSVVLLVIAFFGYRCWKADCLAKTQS